MGSFMEMPPRPRRTCVYVPPVLPYDCDFEVVVSQDAREAGQIWIDVDGRRVVTVEKDGSVYLKSEEGS